MSSLLDERVKALTERLERMRRQDEWHLFQNFVIGLLPCQAYHNVRHSVVRNDFGRDALAIAPDGKACFVAVSFDCTLSKVRKDAKRFCEDENREDAEGMVFVSWDPATETKISEWRAAIQAEFELELTVIHGETIKEVATREGVWRGTCSRLTIPGHRMGYLHISPYCSELARSALRVQRHRWLTRHISLHEWAELGTQPRSRIILGKPGAGKTTTIFEQLERARPANLLIVERNLTEPIQVEALLDLAAGGAVIVFDDAHDWQEPFRQLCASLCQRLNDPAPNIAQQYESTVLLVGARSQEWPRVERELGSTVFEELGLVDGAELTLGPLRERQCAELVAACRDEWGLTVEDRLVGHAAREAARRDATPFYVISMLAAAKNADDLTLRDAHLAELPRDVLGLWRRYWASLDAMAQGFLRLVKLFMRTSTEAQPELLLEAARGFGISQPEMEKSRRVLERSLWIAQEAGAPVCLDVQLEAIDLTASTYETWDRFVDGFCGTQATRLQLRNGTGVHYAQRRLSVAEDAAERRRAIHAGIAHFEHALGLVEMDERRSARAIILNNLSNLWAEGAGLETTRDSRRVWLDKAVAAIEEAVTLYRGLGLHGDLAMSLGASCLVFRAVADVAESEAEAKVALGRSLESIQEGVRLFRELGNCVYLLRGLELELQAHFLLAAAGVPLDKSVAIGICDEGATLAKSMEDERRLRFFEEARQQLMTDH